MSWKIHAAGLIRNHFNIMDMYERKVGRQLDQQEEKAHRVAALIAGYIHEALTPDEHQELDRWTGEREENLRLFEDLTDPKTIQQALDWLRDADGPRMLKKIRGQLKFTPIRRSLLKRLWQGMFRSASLFSK
jgi:hypothetical protein